MKGVKAINEDCAGIEIPEVEHLLLNKGATLVVADGVSTAEAGKEASETAVARFLEEYYQTPDTWSVSHSGEKILSTLNLKLFRKSHEFVTDTKGYLCTFSALVIKSRTAHFFHVGDSRIYLLREGELKVLTRDHISVIGDGKAFLSRALGMDNFLNVDYGRIALEEGDRILLTSDGVHDFIDDQQIIDILSADKPSEQISEQFVDTATANHSDDNISAVVAIVNELPSENLDDYSAKLTRLPFPPDLEPGMKIDGYSVEETLFASSRSQLYLVRDEESGERYAMKTPSRNYEEDISYIDRFIQEEWIGSRINNPYVVRVIRQQRPRTYLYYLMEIVEGVGLNDWMEKNHHPRPKLAISIVKQVAEGLQAFHDNEALHQDLKPGNIMVDENNQVKIVDFGSVYVAGLAEIYHALEHDGALGTASYSDPQYLLGKNPGIKGDLYSLATITYEIFTGNLPYGDKVEHCQTAFDYDRLRYQHAFNYNPVIPVWFDRALEKGVTFDVENRYSTIPALLQDLTHPNPEFLKDDPVEEQKSSTLLFWKLLSGFWFVTFLLVIYLFSQVS
ncbi:MAG: protein kinase [Cellvibrionaceae bacterium]